MAGTVFIPWIALKVVLKFGLHALLREKHTGVFIVVPKWLLNPKR